MSNGNGFCPYKGLMPYEENDAIYFFGREREQQLISSNLLSARLTLLYGPSAAGKSSVLRAGVLPKLHSLMAYNQKESSPPELLVVECHEWRDDPEETLRHKLAGALAKLPGDPVDVAHIPLLEGLRLAANQIAGVVLLVLDQFEEYFQYHVHGEGFEGFSRILIEILQDRALQANVLISIREDALARLDVFKGHIPNLFGNYLRLDFLDVPGARNAILKPLEEYQHRYPERDGMEIELALVEEILEQVKGDKQYGAMSAGRGEGNEATLLTADRVETPYLQLVLTRVWEWEVEHNSRLMRLGTFLNELGGAERIVSSHLDHIVADLSIAEREVASEMFRYLVTSSGTKFAQSIPDLADYTGYKQEAISALAHKFADARKRILKPVAPPLSRPELERYEIFHDVLGAGVLDWSRRFRSERAEKQAVALRRRKKIRNLSFASAIVLAISCWAYYKYIVLWREIRPWAYMTSLTSGKSYPLAGDQILAGRTVDGYQNTIDIQDESNYVSRFHLGIYRRNFVATDMRSLNGTTVNARFLVYGQALTLQDDDIITLAGVDSFRFHPFHYGDWSFRVPAATDHPPTDGWGLFIDGGRRQAATLYRGEYFISKDEQGIHLAENKGADSLGVIRWDGAAMTVMDYKDTMPLDLIIKEGDHEEDYKMGRLNPEVEYPLASSTPFEYSGMPFQIVPITKGIESGEVLQ